MVSPYEKLGEDFSSNVPAGCFSFGGQEGDAATKVDGLRSDNDACLSWITDGKICCLDRGLVDFPGIHGGR